MREVFETLWVILIFIILLVLASIVATRVGKGARRKKARPLFDLFSKVPQAVSIAEVHAAVLSIIMAAVASYAIYHRGRVQEQESKLYESTGPLNSIDYPGFRLVDGYMGQGVWVASDEANRRRLLQLLRRLVTSMPMSHGELSELKPPAQAGENQVQPPGSGVLTPAERGAMIVRILGALFSYYPFRTSAYPAAGMNGISITSPERLGFKDVDAVRQWARDAKSVNTILAWATQVNGQKLHEYLEAFAEEERRREQVPGEELLQKIDSLSIPEADKALIRQRHVEMRAQAAQTTRYMTAADVQTTVDAVRRVEASVEDQLFQYDLFVSRTKRESGTLFAAFLLAGIAFLCGVIVPIINQDASSLFVIWIPLSIYVIGFLFVSRLLAT